MSAGEVLHRARQLGRSAVEQQGLLLAPRVAPLQAACGISWIPTISHEFSTESYAAAADRILSGHFTVFSLVDEKLGFPPRWNFDPATGIEVPLRFGKSIDYRDESQVGNIKYLWEPNRHLELVTLAQAWHLTRDAKYAAGCRQLIESWIDQCPYPSGVNWSSSLELAIRLLNWSFAWHLLGGRQSPIFSESQGAEFAKRWLDCIYQHCHFIFNHLSLYSSANNHLLGELLGLQAATLTWPLWKESRGWSQMAHSRFEQEVLIQNGPDGVNKEQGIWYHHEVADMMLIAGLLARAHDRDFGEGYWNRWEAMLEFISSIMDVAGHVPQIGDADDAVMVRFCPAADFNVYTSLLASGAAICEREDFKVKAGRFDDKSRWLLGDGGAKRFDAVGSPQSRPLVKRSFPDGGYYIIGSDFETSREVRIVADAGPLGFLSIAAHGHADALAFTLSVGGREILVDAGTYAYHTDESWRAYFRGTSAHNTIRVDGLDQSVSGGDFLWTRHANAKCERFDFDASSEVLTASHDGYARLGDPVMHRREWRYGTFDRTLTVSDSLLCRESHRVEMFWHFGELCDVNLEQERILVRTGPISVRIAGPAGLEPVIFRSSVSPPAGWISRRFGTKVPLSTVMYSGAIEGDWRCETRFCIE